MQKIVITGASGGIGLALAKAFASDGNCLLLAGNRNMQALQDLQNTVSPENAEIHLFSGDLSAPETIADLFRTADTLPGKLGLLINNAGLSHVELIQDSTDENMMELISLNQLSYMRASKEAVRRMIPEKRGRIINISSVFGSIGASCEAEYSASKGAVDAFTRALAKELAPSGIQVNAIAPGAIDTVMNGHLSPDEKEALCEEIPMGRMGRPEEVAELALLLSRAPDYLTGQVIRIDGGWI